MFPFGGPFGGGHPMMFGGGHPMLFGGGGGPPRVVVMGGHPMMGVHPLMGGHPLILGRPQIIAVPSSSSSSSSTSWRDMNSRHMGKKTLWHATSESAARSIAADRKMLRGSDGWFGGGIYFAEDKSRCRKKARNGSDFYICAEVDLGTALMLDTDRVSGKSDITYTKLRGKGCDSVFAYNINTGNEYVVYNHGQVKILRIEDASGSTTLSLS